MSVGVSSGSTRERQAAQPPESAVSVTAPPLADVGAVLRQRETRARNLVGELARAFGCHTLDDVMRKELVTLFSQR